MWRSMNVERVQSNQSLAEEADWLDPHDKWVSMVVPVLRVNVIADLEHGAMLIRGIDGADADRVWKAVLV
jgi:hypothetical protein